MLEPGRYLQQGRYRIKAHLNQGGMGTVYLATDRNLSERLVAIKENNEISAETQEQFQQEAVLLARLTHPNLPRVTDHFIEPSGRQYLVMDYISGDDLAEIIADRGQPLSEIEALAWMGQVLDALEYMHGWTDSETGQPRPILHRDIKPSNIKRTPDGRIVLVDFGLVKDQTGFGTRVGARGVTPGYSPLEQYTGGTDVRSDIYAFGATLYTLLTAIRPPDSPAIAGGTPLLTPRAFNPKLSRNTERLIERTMQIQAGERFQNTQELRSALNTKRLLGFGIDKRSGPPPAFPPPKNLIHQQRSAPVSLWIGLVALLILFSATLVVIEALPTILERLNAKTATKVTVTSTDISNEAATLRVRSTVTPEPPTPPIPAATATLGSAGLSTTTPTDTPTRVNQQMLNYAGTLTANKAATLAAATNATPTPTEPPPTIISKALTPTP